MRIIKTREPVVAISYSPDRKLLAIGTSNGVGSAGAFELLSLPNYKMIHRVNEHIGVAGVAFSPSSKLVALALGVGDGENNNWGEIKILNRANGFAVRFEKRVDTIMYSVTFGNSDTTVFFGGDSDSLWICSTPSLSSGQWTYDKVYADVDGPIRTWALAYSPKLNILACGSLDNGGTIILLTPESPVVTDIVSHGESSVRAIAFSPDGRLMVSAGDDKLIRIWGIP